MSTPLRDQLRGIWQEQQAQARALLLAAELKARQDNHRWFVHLLARVFDGNPNMSLENAIVYLSERGIVVPGSNEDLIVTVDGIRFELGDRPQVNGYTIVAIWEAGRRQHSCVCGDGLAGLAAEMAKAEGWGLEKAGDDDGR